MTSRPDVGSSGGHEAATMRTLRVIGFKVPDQTQSPTSVLTSAGGNPQQPSCESPRSRLAEALRAENQHPLTRLRIKTSKRVTKSFSHTDLTVLQVRTKTVASGARSLLEQQSSLSRPETPDSRASASSTPMKIPLALSRVRTCPHALYADVAEFEPSAPVDQGVRVVEEDLKYEAVPAYYSKQPNEQTAQFQSNDLVSDFSESFFSGVPDEAAPETTAMVRGDGFAERRLQLPTLAVKGQRRVHHSSIESKQQLN